MAFQTFPSWRDLLLYIAGGRPVFYQAPLDYRPVRVSIAQVYRNGKIRIRPPAGSGADPFTADSGHLERFRREEE